MVCRKRVTVDSGSANRFALSKPINQLDKKNPRFKETGAVFLQLHAGFLRLAITPIICFLECVTSGAGACIPFQTI